MELGIIVEDEIILEHELAKKLESDGWHRVKATTFTLRGWEPWAQQNCTGKWKNLWPSLMFEKEEDAMLFVLRWS